VQLESFASSNLEEELTMQVFDDVDSDFVQSDEEQYIIKRKSHH
jgi:hypothetical protein